MKFTEERKREAEKVERVVCEYFGIENRELYARRGRESVCNSKCILWYILHYEYGHSYGMMSSVYGKTVRQIKRSVAKIKNGIREQPYYKRMYESVYERIKETPTTI